MIVGSQTAGAATKMTLGATNWSALEHRGGGAPDDVVQWIRIPAWAANLCAVGEALASEAADASRLVAAVGLPFRGFAGPLLALGYVTERLLGSTFTDRFAPGDLVVVMHGASEPYLAEFRGYEAGGAREFAVSLRRTTEEGPCKWLRNRAVRIVRYSGRSRLPKKRVRTLVVEASSFASELLGPEEAAWISGHRLIGFVGNPDEVGRELEEGLRLAGGEGSFADVLTVGGNTRIASPRSLSAIEELAEWMPEFVVFGDASAFRKWRHMFSSSNLAVVGDRSSSAWETEFDIIREAFTTRSGNFEWTEYVGEGGGGLDMVVFRQ